jgi:hypothetical protein
MTPVPKIFSHILPDQSNYSVNPGLLHRQPNHLKTPFEMVRSFNSIAFMRSISITIRLFVWSGGLEQLDCSSNLQMTLQGHDRISTSLLLACSQMNLSDP